MFKYRLRKDFLTANIGEDMGMMDVEYGKYFSMNESAKDIWQLISDGPITKESLISELHKKYDTGKNEMAHDVQEFIDMLIKLKLVVLEKAD